MYTYTPTQWVLLFFLYSLLGWVWECCYVSARQGRWVNRGFLRGPALPIYGFGAILVLHAALPYAQNPLAAASVGALWATVLEYAVGAAMEGMFHVRYWDYSQERWNLRGYVCLKSSIAWGVFSLLLVRLLHPAADRLMRALPGLLTSPLAALLLSVLTVDTVRSAQAAFDLKAVLRHLSEEKEDFRRIAQRAETLCAAAAEELAAFRQKTESPPPSPPETRRRPRVSPEEALSRLRASRLRAFSALSQALEDARNAWAADPSPAAAQRREEVERLLSRVRQHQDRAARPQRRHGAALRLLLANPGAKARSELQEALSALRQHLEP